jgi:hypothetical protein
VESRNYYRLARERTAREAREKVDAAYTLQLLRSGTRR